MDVISEGKRISDETARKPSGTHNRDRTRGSGLFDSSDEDMFTSFNSCRPIVDLRL